VPPRVALFATCLADQFWPEVLQATVAVLERAGCAVDFDPRQTCCGQPACNSGFAAEARSVARHFVDVFADAEHVVAPSGSCVAMVHRFADLFAGEPHQQKRCADLAHRTHELSHFLVDVLAVTDLGAHFPHHVAWHDPCHARRELHVHDQPRRLLAAVRGLHLHELHAKDSCCGFGGTFSVKYPELSTAMLDHKLADLPTEVTTLASLDSSCLMQMRGRLQRQGRNVHVLHLAEILASR
jgi:L-lactate dehydrogenase complex protein LldE